MRVLVLGCGPAGLLAAYAAEQTGAHVHIYSYKMKSKLGGAQYLHESIPGLTSEQPDGFLNYVKLGTREGYAKKVYGSPDAPCSWDAFPVGRHPAWSMEALYDDLWDRYESRVVNRLINSAEIRSLRTSHDLVLCSLPARSMCENIKHEFMSAKVVLARGTPFSLPSNTIEYNGLPLAEHYRAASIFGHDSSEYPNATLNITDSALGIKPLWHDCDCFPGIVRVGRFGRWEKGILVHHAYRQAVEALAERGKHAVL